MMRKGRGRGVKREGVSAEAGFKDCDEKQRGSRIVDFGFWNVVHRLTTAATATTHSLTHKTNDNKQPRELSLSQSHTQWASGLRFPFQKHTVPVQTTMTTAYIHDHTQESVQDGALKGN